MPVDYRLPAEERFALMDELSGLYLPGDSTTSILDDAYKSAFIDTLIYLEESVQIKKEHFPVFMMGNSLQTLVRARQESVNTLKPMEDLRNEMLMVEMLGMPSDSYFFNGMDREEKQAVFNTGTFFNRQSSGLRLRELAKDAELFKMLEPLATFISASESEEDQFIAIAEAHNLPLYVFTYGLEMTQFYFEDPTLNNDEYLLDHSLVARTHSQFIANTIADEGRQSVHEFADPSSVYDKLIIHKPLMSVVYQNMDTDLSTTMPAGMSEHEIYLLQ